jgi:hypothetical protein
MANARKKPVAKKVAKAEAEASYGDLMEEALARCTSDRLVYVSPTAFALKREHVLVGEEQVKEIDLAHFHLPNSRLLDACSLAEDRTLAIATVLAIDSHLLSVGSTKDTHRTVANLVGTLAKLWEWGRLRGLYRPSDWKSTHFQALGKTLGRSKWAGGMQLERRVKALIRTRPEASLIVREDSTKRATLREGAAALLHSNLSIQELGSVRSELLQYAGRSTDAVPWEPRRPSVSWMVQTLRCINELVRIPKKFGFATVPYPDPHVQAKKLAVANKRTRNMTVNQAVALLVHSYDWVQNKANATISLIDEVGRIAEQVALGPQNSKARAKLADDLWQRSAVRVDAEAAFGTAVEMVRVDEVSHQGALSVAHAVDCLMSSSFILIAGLNARRKDEICHRKLGMSRDSMRIINEELGVYQGDFYIMKTFKDYAPYFVNRATYDAWHVLTQIEAAQHRLEALLLPEAEIPDPNHSLFWRRSYTVTTGELTGRVWYRFELGRTGAGKRFLDEALGATNTMRGTAAHMFRRFYAIIYFYRFEHGSLLHLRYQLAHFNLDCTQQYVSDALIELAADRISVGIKKSPEEVRAAMQSEWRELAVEIKAVGNEKMYESIRGLVGGASASGGFPALLLRLQRRLSADVDYRQLDKDAQAKRIAALVARRGHAIRPLPYGDCLAGASAARNAKCAETPGTGPAPENATPDVCAKCAQHWVSKGHLEGQRLDLAMLDKEIASQAIGTVQSNARIRQRENLRRTIWLHEARIG